MRYDNSPATKRTMENDSKLGLVTDFVTELFADTKPTASP
jgi:hypothetical protein